MKYCLLINPKHYKNYLNQSDKIALNEFALLNKKYNNFASNAKIQNICDINYLTFESEKISDDLNKKISNLSFVMGIFENIDDLLKPIEKKNENFVNKNISSLLKYSGKTNEDFTSLMLSVALSSIKDKDNYILLDPICGKGTSLYEGLIKGFDCYGIEIAPKVVEESAVFLKKFLEIEKFKFNYKKEKFSGAGKSFKAEKHIFDIYKTKENKIPKKFEIVSANTVFSDKILKNNYFDIIIGDLPYGVKHSNITNEKQNSFTRSPKELLTQSLKVWKNLLNDDGVLVISWNTFLLKRKDFEILLAENGYQTFDSEEYLNFEHRVDQAINRDFIVAKKINKWLIKNSTI